MEWSSSLATGIRQIDLQHQELIGIINDLERARSGAQWDEAVADVMPRLKAYVMFHFATEESMMKEAGIPLHHFQSHEAEHRAFSGRIEELGAQDDPRQYLAGFVEYLKTWLTHHIMKTDMELARLLGQAQASLREN